MEIEAGETRMRTYMETKEKRMKSTVEKTKRTFRKQERKQNDG